MSVFKHFAIFCRVQTLKLREKWTVKINICIHYLLELCSYPLQRDRFRNNTLAAPNKQFLSPPLTRATTLTPPFGLRTATRK